MKNSLFLTVRGVVLILALAMTACTDVETDQVTGKTNQVLTNYMPPKNPRHQALYEALKEHQTLKKIQEFLSPFRLQSPLDITLTGCDGEADAMYSDNEIKVCYEYIEDLQKYMPKETTPAGVEPIDTLIGPFFDTILHEFAHALFDYHDVPILGREEDAADQVAAYIYLHLGKEEARRMIMGTVYVYMLEVQDTDPPDMEEFADEHSTSEQRLINLTCLAYGSDPVLFADLPAVVGAPQYRVDICEEEYELLTYTYQALIGPFVDQELAEKVYDRSWLPGENWDLPGNR